MKIHLKALLFVVLFFVLASLAPSLTMTVQAQGPTFRGPFTRQATAARFDGDLRSLANAAPSATPKLRELRGRFSQSNSSADLSGLLPSAVSHALPTQPRIPGPISSFDGIPWTNIGWPPDTNGDVGPNHYVQAVNSSLAVYSKTGTLLAGPITFDAVFAPLPNTTPCGNNDNQGDPVVLYDQLADRWVVSDFGFAIGLLGNPQPPYYQCIAVSKTGDPVAGGWYLYALLADNTFLNDYPKIGLWPDAYYMTANMYNLNNNNVFVRVWALDRNAMINGTLNSIFFDLPTCTGSTASCPNYALLPGNLRGALPPAGSPNYLANIAAINTTAGYPFRSNVLRIWKFHVDWNTPANSTFMAAPNVTVARFTEPVAKSGATLAYDVVPQAGTTTKLDSLGDRLMMQLQYRNIGGAESLWATHTVAIQTTQGNVAAVRWYQINITGGVPSLAQQGNVVANDGVFRWMPSIAVDQKGNAVVGYSASSSTINPGIRYAGRLVTDPSGIMAQGEAILINGTGSQTTYPLLGPITRWGDYSAMTIDPSDGCTFWYTTEYYKTNGYQWSTRIGSTKFPSWP